MHSPIPLRRIIEEINTSFWLTSDPIPYTAKSTVFKDNTGALTLAKTKKMTACTAFMYCVHTYARPQTSKLASLTMILCQFSSSECFYITMLMYSLTPMGWRDHGEKKGKEGEEERRGWSGGCTPWRNGCCL